MPVISVILPVFNGEKYIRKSIDSVLNQSFQDFELIIVNDGSTDDTMDIINVSFAYAMADGSVSANGTSVFSNYNTYIKTKARQNGCYVVLSLAPSSSWTTVANPENDLIDTLATNIVNTICIIIYI